MIDSTAGGPNSGILGHKAPRRRRGVDTAGMTDQTGVYKAVSASQFRSNFGDTIAHAEKRDHAVIVTRHGTPVAAVIDFGLFERIFSMRAALDRLSAQITRAFSDKQLLNGIGEIDRLVEAARRRRPF